MERKPLLDGQVLPYSPPGPVRSEFFQGREGARILAFGPEFGDIVLYEAGGSRGQPMLMEILELRGQSVIPQKGAER